MPASKYTAEVLAPLVRESRSLSEVIRKLGLEPNGGNHRHISRCVRVANLDTSHFQYGRSRFARFTRGILEPIVHSSTSVAQVLAQLGMRTDGGPHRDMSSHLRALGLDTSHFRGSAWSRGETARTNAVIDRAARKRRLPDDQVFIANAPHIHGTTLARRLVEKGVPYQCKQCGISEWRGQPIVLHLDHINGVHNDNRLENLRLLCPNCHSQTPTYCNRAREGAVLYVVSARERGGTGRHPVFRWPWA